MTPKSIKTTLRWFRASEIVPPDNDRVLVYVKEFKPSIAT
jgi:hypothetical protein